MINYTNKQNERLIGQSIVGELHTVGIIGVAVVSPGFIRLVEVPQAPAPLSTVSVTGAFGPYNEIFVGFPTGGQFLVDYTTGVITFDVAQDTHAISVSYIGLGSEIAAEDINELQGPVGVALNLNGSLSNNIVKPASISNTGTDDFTFPRDVVITREAKAVDFITASASPASTGVVRLSHSNAVVWRDNAGSGDSALATDGLDNLTWKGSVIASPSGAVTSVTGTADEILANGITGSAQVGAITLTTPQAIGTSSTPSFASETLSNTTDQLSLGTTRLIVINAPTPATASRTVTIPDPGTAANFVLSESAQTLNGALTLTALTVMNNATPVTDALTINNTDSSQGLLVNGVIRGYRDNATCLRVSGLDFTSNPVQSYSGVFYDTNYDALGSLKTRFITGSNTGMDLELQTDNYMLLDAMNAGNTGTIKLSASTSVNVNARNTPDRNAEKYLIIDRVDTSTFGTGNTSDVNLNVNTGNLALLAGNTTGTVILPTLTTAERTALVPVIAMVVYDTDLSQFMGWNNSSWVVLG